MYVALAVIPVIATLGAIAAIIICVFVFIFALTALAFNLAMTFGLSWLREKMELFKLLRPTVDSVNKASEAALQGKAPSSGDGNIVRVVAQVPNQVTAVDKKVVALSDSVAEKVIEYRARTVQAKTIVKTFFAPRKKLPGEKLLASSEPEQKIASQDEYLALIEDKLPRISNGQNGPTAEQRDTSSQAKNAIHR
jgi:hypothetical protein